MVAGLPLKLILFCSPECIYTHARVRASIARQFIGMQHSTTLHFAAHGCWGVCQMFICLPAGCSSCCIATATARPHEARHRRSKMRSTQAWRTESHQDLPWLLSLVYTVSRLRSRPGVSAVGQRQSRSRNYDKSVCIAAVRRCSPRCSNVECQSLYTGQRAQSSTDVM